MLDHVENGVTIEVSVSDEEAWEHCRLLRSRALFFVRNPAQLQSWARQQSIGTEPGRAEQRVRSLRKRLDVVVEDENLVGAEVVLDHPATRDVKGTNTTSDTKVIGDSLVLKGS